MVEVMCVYLSCYLFILIDCANSGTTADKNGQTIMAESTNQTFTPQVITTTIGHGYDNKTDNFPSGIE